MRGPPLFVALLALAPAATPAQPTPAPVSTPRPALERPGPDDLSHFIFFASGSARVQGDAVIILDRAANAWRRFGRAGVEIVANADHEGVSAANRRLSARRARAVAAALARRGIPRGAMVLRPMGEDRPLVMTPDGVAEAQNRYVLVAFPDPQLR